MSRTKTRPTSIEQIPVYAEALKRQQEIGRQLAEAEQAAELLAGRGTGIDAAAAALLRGESPEDATELARQREAVAHNLKVLRRAAELASEAVQVARQRAVVELRREYLDDHRRIAGRMRAAVEALLEARREEHALELEAGITHGAPWQPIALNCTAQLEHWLSETENYAL